MLTRLVPVFVAFALMARAAGPSAQFSTTTNLVVLNVRVTDGDGQHVSGLTERSFAVYEDGKPQTITSVRRRRRSSHRRIDHR